MLRELFQDDAAPPPSYADRLELRPIPWLNRTFLAGLAVIAVAALGAALILIDQLLTTPPVWAGLAIVLAVAVGACVWSNARHADHRHVVLRSNGLLVPLPRGFGRRARLVEFDELCSIELTRPRGRTELVLNVRGRWPVRVCGHHVIHGDLARFHRSLLITAGAANPQLEVAHRLFMRRRRPPAVALLAGAILVLAFLASSSGSDDPVHRLVVIGGLNDWLVNQGEIHRLGAAALLHADWPHLLVNLTLLIVIGLRLEYVTGPVAFAGALVSGMLTGNVCAYLVGGQTVVIGASGGIFGLLALYAHTLYRRGRHLPTRTQFAPNAYLLAALALLFIPLPGYAQPVHAGGFLGGLLWAFADRGSPRRLMSTWAAGGALVIAASSWHGFELASSWRRAEAALIERMAGDPSARRGTLDLVGWYALQHEDPTLARLAVERLERLEAQDASSAGTLAELLLARGDLEAAAARANESFELRGDRVAAERLMRIELKAYASLCRPLRYGTTAGDPPLSTLAGDVLEFVSSQPLYVHARVNRSYLLVRTDVPVPTPDIHVDDVVVVGYSDKLPWRRRPRVLHITAAEVATACSTEPGPT